MRYQLHEPSRRTKLMLWVVAVCLVATLATTASAHPAKSATPYNVLYVAEQSGVFATVGNAFLHGAVAGARILNASGGVLGHRVTMKIVDDGSDPAKAVQLVQAELGGGTKYNQVVADVGVISSAVSPILAQHPDILFTGAAATITQTPQALPNGYFAGPTQQTQASGAVYWAKKLGYKSIGMMSVDNSNGRSYGQVYKQLAEIAGLKFIDGYAPAGTVDATAQVQSVLAAKPDVLVLTGSNSAFTFLPARGKLGNTTPVLCDQGCAGSSDWTVFQPEALVNVKALTLPFLILNDPLTKTFAYKQYLKYIDKLEATHPLGYNAGITSYEDMLLARAAARKCNCVDGAKMVKQLQTVTTSKTVPGWIGPRTLFGPGIQSVSYPGSFYKLVPAKPLVDGFWSPK